MLRSKEKVYMNKTNIIAAVLMLSAAQFSAAGVNFDQGLDVKSVVAEASAAGTAAPVSAAVKVNKSNCDFYSDQGSCQSAGCSWSEGSFWGGGSCSENTDPWGNKCKDEPYMDRVSREYHSEGTGPGCRLLTLNAQSESEFKMQLQAREYGTVDIYENTPRYEFGCIASYDSVKTGSEDYTAPYGHGREITVVIKPRALEAWESEAVNVCMGPNGPFVDTEKAPAKTLYEYKVTEENTSSFFKKATKFTLIPGAKKPVPAGSSVQ